MSDLTEFLLARIAEDEVAPRSVVRQIETGDFSEVSVTANRGLIGVTSWDPARVLAECEAKRRIVERRPAICLPGRDLTGNTLAAVHEEVDRQREYVFRLLALPFAGHPEYRDEWRP